MELHSILAEFFVGDDDDGFYQSRFESQAQTSHTENIPYALKNQPKLDIKIHSRTPLPAQSAHPKGRQIVHETLQ